MSTGHVVQAHVSRPPPGRKKSVKLPKLIISPGITVQFDVQVEKTGRETSVKLIVVRHRCCHSERGKTEMEKSDDLVEFVRHHSDSDLRHSPPKSGPAHKINSPDRFIPIRQPRRWRIAYSPYATRQNRGEDESTLSPPLCREHSDFYTNDEIRRQAEKSLYRRVLSNELMGYDMPEAMEDLLNQENRNHQSLRRSTSSSVLLSASSACSLDASNADSSLLSYGSTGSFSTIFSGAPKTSQRNVFTYGAKKPVKRSHSMMETALSPLTMKTNVLLSGPTHPSQGFRKISPKPYSVVDAPGLENDYYLNLIDWSQDNVVAVGLGYTTQLWTRNITFAQTFLCTFEKENDRVTAVRWADSRHSSRLAVGTSAGYVHVFDVATQKRISVVKRHIARAGSLAWNGQVLASGGRDRSIYLTDFRQPTWTTPSGTYIGHKQEVCGLQWSPDYSSLASGGNDNKVLVWSYNATGGSSKPVSSYAEHTAAVKALAWSPHQHGLLASGGGTNDRTIRLWNTLTDEPIMAVDTGSQVCNLAWSRYAPELLSTHGYQDSQVALWEYPSMRLMAKLLSHSQRVLYLAVAPDGKRIVTGAGDQSLRFWEVFSPLNGAGRRSSLDLMTAIR